MAFPTRVPALPLAYASLSTLGLGAMTVAAASAGLRGLVCPRIAPAAPTAILDRREGPVEQPRVALVGPGADQAGFVALSSVSGRLLAGPVEHGHDQLWRQTVPLPGLRAPELRLGERLLVHHDPWVDTHDPLAIGADSFTVASEDGALTCTATGPESKRAVVFVHGRGGRRTTGWWFAPTAAVAGWRTVMPAYRNDTGDAPMTGRYLLGGEWVDLAAVLGHLAGDGVEQVVLVGWSMGGNICASYLRHRRRHPQRFAVHPQVVGLVLDAPALDWGPVLAHVARNRRLPRRLASVVMGYGQLFRRIDWRSLDHVREPGHLDLPVLMYHGGADDLVPLSISQALAAADPQVRLEVFEGAGHCRSVNADPARYLAAFADLLEQAGQNSR